MAKQAAADDVKMRNREYLAALPTDVRRRMRAMRSAILAGAPGAVDTFSYGIPAFRLHGKPFVWYAAWKRHLSLYPMTTAIRRAHASALKGFVMAKGTVQFPLDEPLPRTLVTRLARSRAAEVRKAAR